MGPLYFGREPAWWAQASKQWKKQSCNLRSHACSYQNMENIAKPTAIKPRPIQPSLPGRPTGKTKEKFGFTAARNLLSAGGL
jgi:hypothetical protein